MIAASRVLLDVLLAGLWQGVSIALVSAVVLALAGRRLNAATRFWFWHAVLASVIAVPLLTTLPHVAEQGSRATGQLMLVYATDMPPAHSADALPLPATQIPVMSSDALVVVLAGAWILGVLFFALRCAVSALRLVGLVRRSDRVGMRENVPLLAERGVPVPLAVGFFAPVIVVPAELASQGGEQFEAIVLHELAHVRRYDAWTNAYERVVHALLFFNPAVGLVLRAIALEREAACDDWAVERSRNVDLYMRSLASFALELAGYRPQIACSLTGFGSATVARLRRLGDARRNRALTLARFPLGGFVVMLVLIGLIIKSFGPSIGFAAETPPIAALENPCPRIVQGPPPVPQSLPRGLRADLQIPVTSSGVQPARVVHSSGNAAFDRFASTQVGALLAAVGTTVPPHCNGLPRNTFEVSLRGGKTTIWTVRNAGTKAPVEFTLKRRVLILPPRPAKGAAA